METKVLVVEDSNTMARVLSYLIRQQLGFTPVIMNSLAEVKSYLDTAPCDHVAAIVDLNLPDAPNGEAVDLVMGKGIPVIVLVRLGRSGRANHVAGKGCG
ncbi:MAG: hypothetical protein V7707_11565 [Motiliproteus sp.]